MSLNWIFNPILCDGEMVSVAISPREPLLPLREQIGFKASLLYNVWQAHACDGRQMSVDDFDHMENFEARFSDASLDENAMFKLVDEFGDFIPEYLANGPVDVPQRALIWTQQDANKPIHGSGEVGRF